MVAEGAGEDPLSSILRSQRILLRDLVRTVRKGEGLTLQQVAVLRILENRGPTSMNRLAEELLVTRPNVTGIIDRMEGKGLVTRKESEEDRRMTEVAVTQKGAALRRRITEDYRESFSRLLDVLSEEEKDTLAGLLERVSGKLGQAKPKG